MPSMTGSTRPDMNPSVLYQLLCCPVCKGDLELRGDGSAFDCRRCRFGFPIVEGIPVLLPCNVETELPHLFTRYWDTEDKATLYDNEVEGGDSIFGVYNHLSEIYGLTCYFDPDKLDLFLDAG